MKNLRCWRRGLHWQRLRQLLLDECHEVVGSTPDEGHRRAVDSGANFIRVS